MSERSEPKPPTRREVELELDRARLAFLAARTPYARRKALRRLEAAKRAQEVAGRCPVTGICGS